MRDLNEQQLKVMLQSYPGFREKDAVIRRIKEDNKRYRAMLENGPTYIPGLEGIKSTYY